MILLSKWFRKLHFSLFLALGLIVPISSYAASCCGGGFAVPSLITGDDKAILTTSVSYSKVETDVLASGIWQRRQTDDVTDTYKLEAARIFADRYQAGFSLPIETRTSNGALGGSSSGLGDVALQAGYEYLPDWDYNPYRPKGVGFISLTLPTGKSVYESSDGLDSRGRGFMSIGVGTVLTKTWFRWDANLTAELHHSFEKVVSNSQIFGTIVPGNGESLSYGMGYNIGDLRLGGALAWYYEDPINVESSTPTQGSAQTYMAGTASASYRFSDEWAGSASYSDQTLFGDPSNATLSKSLLVSVQRRWAR